MGAVLLMVLALVLPVAPAAMAQGPGSGEGGDAELQAAAVLAAAEDADCQQSQNLTTRYFVTLVSSTGSRIPSTNGGTPATVTLIGAGTQNAGQTIPLSVGDLENQAQDGRDVASTPGVAFTPVPWENPDGTPRTAPVGFEQADGDCNDQGDQAPTPVDSLANDYGSPFVNTSRPIGDINARAFSWNLFITAPGHESRLLDIRTLVDGIPATAAFPGSGCLRADRGCLISLGTIALNALSVPQPGRGSIGGVVTDVNGAPLGGIEVVFYRQLNQDAFDNAGGPVAENQAVSVLTNANGSYFLGDLWPGQYSVTVADTRFAIPCAVNANCGIQPATKQVAVTAGLQSSTNFAVPTDVQAKQAPGTAVGANQIGVFGYVTEGSTGARLGLGTTAGPNNTGGTSVVPGYGPQTFQQVLLTFTPGTSGFTTVTAFTDQQGRYQALLGAGVSYTVQVTLPPGFTGSCTAGGNANATTPFLCSTGVAGTDRFTFPASVAATAPLPTPPIATATTAPITGLWNDGGSFVLAPSTQAIAPLPGQTLVRRLMAVVPGIYRNPDTSFTGVDVETIQVRVVNAGNTRTGVQIEWYSTSSDDIATLVKTDTLDLNVNAVGIFTRSLIPDGCTRCMAEIYAIDIDGPGLAYGISALSAVVSHRVVDADNALTGTNAISFEDIFPTGSTSNANYVVPLAFKNYGGGVHKWNSIVTGCLTRGVPGAQPVVMEFFPVAGASGGPFNITRSTNPGGCLVINLNSFDPDDPEFYDPLAALPDGAYTVSVSSTAGLPVPIAPERPGGFFATGLNYTTTGRMATQTNAAPPVGGGEGLAGFRELYGPLLFKKYNDWNSGVIVSNFRARLATVQGLAGGGGGGSGISISMYGEDGTLFGTFLDRLGNEAARVYYLPTLPIQLPDGFRGTSIISIGDNTFGTRTAVGAHHVNYERNQAMAFNFVRHDQLTGPASPYYRPCTQMIGSTTDANPAFPFGAIPGSAPFTGAAFVTCLSVPDAQRRFTSAPRGSGATFEVGMGPTTGVRIFNPDVAKLGLPAYVFATYTDAAGIYYTDSYTTFTIPAYGTGTIFMGADARLPDIFDGAMFIQATQPIAAISNVVDYRVTDRDGSYSANIMNQTGQTQ